MAAIADDGEGFRCPVEELVLSICDRNIRHVQRRHIDRNFFRGYAQFLAPASKLAGADLALVAEYLG